MRHLHIKHDCSKTNAASCIMLSIIQPLMTNKSLLRHIYMKSSPLPAQVPVISFNHLHHRTTTTVPHQQQKHIALTPHFISKTKSKPNRLETCKAKLHHHGFIAPHMKLNNLTHQDSTLCTSKPTLKTYTTSYT